MALFGNKKKTTKKSEEKTVVAKAESAPVASNLSSVLKNPRITEKAAYAAEKNVYVFDIDPRSNKEDVKNAVISAYKVTPVKINITKVAKKPVKSRTIRKTYYKGGGKKAYVYLKKGDTIQIV